MALSKNQIITTLKLFGTAYIGAQDMESRKGLYHSFIDTFSCDVKDLEAAMRQELINLDVSSDLIREFDSFVNKEETKDFLENCRICELAVDDKKQIERLLSKEIGTLIHASAYGVGTLEDFMKKGLSFTVKYDDKVVGIVLADTYLEYGSCEVYLSMFAVSEGAQGKGVGRMMMNHLKKLAKDKDAFSIKLYTKKTLKAYDIYRHFGFRENIDSDGVYMSMYSI